jgi:hypothetical protein
MNRSGLIRGFVSQSLLAALLPASIVLAGTETYDYKAAPPPRPEPWCERPAPLEIRIGFPGWISRLEGDFGVKGLVAPLDISFDTLLNTWMRFQLFCRDTFAITDGNSSETGSTSSYATDSAGRRILNSAE